MYLPLCYGLQMSCRLYLVIPPKPEPRDFVESLRRALSAGDVAALQLRLKDASDEEIKRAVEVLMPIAQQRGVALILNDRPDLAERFGCDGVHIGQEDGTYSEAGAAIGPDRIVGVTCHNSRRYAIEAAVADMVRLSVANLSSARTRTRSNCSVA